MNVTLGSRSFDIYCIDQTEGVVMRYYDFFNNLCYAFVPSSITRSPSTDFEKAVQDNKTIRYDVEHKLEFSLKTAPILQALAEQSRIVRLPLNQVGSLNKIGKALSKFEQENERRPSAEELAEQLEIPVDKISDTLKVSGRHISVDAPFVEGEDNSLLDVLTNDDSPMADSSLNQESLSKEVDRALNQLHERERDILKMFFGIGCQEMTLEEIGAKFDLTRERVRQIKEKAIRKLKGQKSILLKSYLGD